MWQKCVLRLHVCHVKRDAQWHLFTSVQVIIPHSRRAPTLPWKPARRETVRVRCVAHLEQVLPLGYGALCCAGAAAAAAGPADPAWPHPSDRNQATSVQLSGDVQTLPNAARAHNVT